MAKHAKETFHQNFKRFFLRGLAILLPSVLTIWLLIAAYQFIADTIAEPINAGVRELVLDFSSYPTVSQTEIDVFKRILQEEEPRKFYTWDKNNDPDVIKRWARRDKLESIWTHSPLRLVGVILAIILIYLAGGILGSFIGRRIYQRGELVVAKVPVLRSIYPSIKQVTDFFVGERPKDIKFNRVVAVEYPRKGMWSIGLLTGETMQAIENNASQRCATVFIPSSPTPFTGYVITVPVEDMIDLPITIDDAIRFTVSGGVVVPASQVIERETPLIPKSSDDSDSADSPAADAPADAEK